MCVDIGIDKQANPYLGAHTEHIFLGDTELGLVPNDATEIVPSGLYSAFYMAGLTPENPIF